MLRAINHSISRVFGRTPTNANATTATKTDSAAESVNDVAPTPAPAPAPKPSARTTMLIADYSLERDQFMRSLMADCFGVTTSDADRQTYAYEFRKAMLQRALSLCSSIKWHNSRVAQALAKGEASKDKAFEWSSPKLAELAASMAELRIPYGDVRMPDDQLMQHLVGAKEIFNEIAAFQAANPADASSPLSHLTYYLNESDRALGRANDAYNLSWVPSDAEIKQMQLPHSISSVPVQKIDASTGTVTALSVTEMSGGRGGYAWQWSLRSLMEQQQMDLVVLIPTDGPYALHSLPTYIEGCSALADYLAGVDHHQQQKQQKLGRKKLYQRKSGAAQQQQQQQPAAPSRRMPNVVLVATGSDASLTSLPLESMFPEKPAAAAAAAKQGAEGVRAFILEQARQSMAVLSAAGGVVMTSWLADPTDEAASGKLYRALDELRSVEPAKATARAVALQKSMALDVVVVAASTSDLVPAESHVAAEA